MNKKFLAGLIMFFVAGIANATIINFDDIVAPSLFVEQTPLAEEYASLGVHFSGSGEVLNSGSNFGVGLGVPFSSPNFLAFNTAASAFPPETINFDFDIDYFSLDFAGSSGIISLTGFNDGDYVGTVSLLSTTSNSWSTISLLLPSVFDSVVFNIANTDGTFVVDNLYFNESTPVPEPASMFLFAVGISGLVGTRLRRKKKRV